MSVLVDVKTQQFAVISVHSQPRRERLVLAYRDENSLRDCLSEASILAVGYRSREEALAIIDSSIAVPPAAAPKERAELRSVVGQTLSDREASQLSSEGRFGTLSAPSTIVQFLQHGLVFAIATIYSENLLSAIVRALVSF